MNAFTQIGSNIANIPPIFLNSAKLTIVVPCYNEANRLNTNSFLDYANKHNDIHFLFVDDGSTDKTTLIINSMIHANPEQFSLLKLEENSGKAEAVRQGMLYALNFNSELIGYWDADLATPLSAINDFCRVFDRLPAINIVFGSRIKMLGHKIDRPFKRRFVSKTCSILARLALQMPVKDTQCGAKIFRNSNNLRKAFQEKFTTSWLFDVELFARLKKGNDSVSFYELPLIEWEEIEGSKLSIRAVIQSGVSMLNIISNNYVGVSFIKN